MSALPPPDLTGLAHAGGTASDTGPHLLALTEGTRSARLAATEHLDAAIVPGARAYPATAAVAGYVITLLNDDAVTDPEVVVELLYFLGQVTEAAEGRAERGGVAACRQLLPGILRAAEHCERHGEADVRVEAADTAESAIEAMERLGMGAD